MVLEYQALGGWEARLTGMVSGLHALVLYSEAINSQATHSLALGHTENVKKISSAVSDLCLYALNRVLPLRLKNTRSTRAMGVCVHRSPMTCGSLDTDGWMNLN